MSRSLASHPLASALLFAAVVGSFARRAEAAPTKEQCLASHGNGQDLRARGQLSQARQEFLSCAQSSCPTLVQADCARFGDELESQIPTVTFAARDASGGDVPDTAVYVDDKLVASRLEGKSFEVDPGKHSVRFTHDGKDTRITVVVNQGERGREVIGNIGQASAPSSGVDASHSTAPAATRTETSKSLAPFALVGAGAAATITGVVLLAVGLSKVPSNCSLSSNTCTAAPGDPVFDTAGSGARLADIGIGVGIVGLAAVAGGLVWYGVEPARERTVPATAGLGFSPFFDGHNAGLGAHGSF